MFQSKSFNTVNILDKGDKFCHPKKLLTNSAVKL